MQKSVDDTLPHLIQPVSIIAGQAVALDCIVGLAIGAHLHTGSILHEVSVETL